MRKVRYSFLAPENITRFRRAGKRWIRELSKQRPELLTWAQELLDDHDVTDALLKLTDRYGANALELLNFLTQQRATHWPSRALRAKLRQMGKRWKDVERLAARAFDESKNYLGDMHEKASEVDRTARQVSEFFIRPVAKRPSEREIAECKEDILWALRQYRVTEVNEYGWILLRAVFGSEWVAGNGKDQIAAFRAIPKPFRGKVKDRKGFEIVMERAKLGVFNMSAKSDHPR